MFLVIACAGFIESNTTELLLEPVYDTIGLDNFNDVYPPPKRLRLLKPQHFLVASKQTDFQISPYIASRNRTEFLVYLYQYLSRIGIAMLQYFAAYGSVRCLNMNIFNHPYYRRRYSDSICERPNSQIRRKLLR